MTIIQTSTETQGAWVFGPLAALLIFCLHMALLGGYLYLIAKKEKQMSKEGKNAAERRDLRKIWAKRILILQCVGWLLFAPTALLDPWLEPKPTGGQALSNILQIMFPMGFGVLILALGVGYLTPWKRHFRDEPMDPDTSGGNHVH